MRLFPNRPYWDAKGEFVRSHDGPPVCTCPPTPPSNLCAQCLSLNLRHVIFCSPERELIDLGRLDAMISKPDCDLCSLIVLGCRQVWPGLWIGVTDTKCSLNAVDISRQLQNGYAMQVTATHKDYSFQWIEFEVVIRPGGDSFPAEKRLEVYQKVHLEKMKGLLADCENTHEECKLILKTPENMRVIDVENLNIVEAPSDCRYCALSYVWGKPSIPWLTLTRYNTEDLKAPNSLAGANLPRTILDAIQACKELDERYLWVDSLCIVQDDPVIQKSQIDIMDMIYASAAVTLVAAAGNDANAGFPGASIPRGDPGRQTITIQDMEISNALPRMKDMVEPSTWNTRGWTYQERVLSHRCIFFTTSQMYYTCSQGVQNEVSDRLSATVWTTGRARKDLKTIAFMKLYSDRVTAYTLRSLTSQADIIRAFQGILNKMTKDYRERFYFGLPEGQFEQALTWQRSRHSRDESIEIAPSWSWASARSPVKYTIPEIGIHLSQAPLPAFWKDGEEPSQFLIPWFLNSEGTLVPLKTNTSNLDPLTSSQPSSLDNLPGDLRALALQKLGRLLFPTQRVYMGLRNSVPYKTHDTWWTDYVTDVDFSQTSILSILLPSREDDISSSAETLAGFIEMEKTWAEVNLDGDDNNAGQKRWEFLAISLTTSKSDDYMHYHLTQQRNVNAPLVWSRNVRQLVVHVLLVESGGDDGVKRRLGVGKVFLDMWERANPDTTWVVLE